jgi:hypothetical protein
LRRAHDLHSLVMLLQSASVSQRDCAQMPGNKHHRCVSLLFINVATGWTAGMTAAHRRSIAMRPEIHCALVLDLFSYRATNVCLLFDYFSTVLYRD